MLSVWHILAPQWLPGVEHWYELNRDVKTYHNALNYGKTLTCVAAWAGQNLMY